MNSIKQIVPAPGGMFARFRVRATGQFKPDKYIAPVACIACTEDSKIVPMAICSDGEYVPCNKETPTFIDVVYAPTLRDAYNVVGRNTL